MEVLVAQSIFLGAYGNSVGMLPGDAFDSMVKDLQSTATQTVKDTYAKASSAFEEAGGIATKRALVPLRSGIKAVSQLSTQLAPQVRALPGMLTPIVGQAQTFAKEQVRELGAEMGAGAAAGARADTMEAVKRWAPWVIGGVAVAGVGLWLVRR